MPGTFNPNLLDEYDLFDVVSEDSNLSGNTELCQTLIDRGDDVNATRLDQKHNWVGLLDLAAQNGYLDVCKILLDHGAEINKRNRLGLGFTPLDSAAHAGQLEVCQLLLDRGANIDYLDDKKETPLHLAAKTGQWRVCELLLNKGAKINAKDVVNNRPLHSATEHERLEVCQLLLDRGADLYATNNAGYTALRLAINLHNTALGELLLKYYTPDALVLKDQLMPPLHQAAREGVPEVCQVIINKNPESRTLRTKEGDTTLHYLAQGTGMWLNTLATESGNTTFIHSNYDATLALLLFHGKAKCDAGANSGCAAAAPEDAAEKNLDSAPTSRP